MTALANPVAGLGHMLGQPFIRHALLAGTAVALCCGPVGYFLVLRAQVFSGEALSHVAYTGAAAALAAGVDARIGLFAATIGVGAGFALLGRDGVADDVVIGTSFAWILGVGTLFAAVYTTSHSAGDAGANARVLFGSVFGISTSAAVLAAVVAASIVLVLMAIARPLLFATIDPAVAVARGVPVRFVGVVFLALVGASAAEASQVVGALLLFGLLAAPAAAALRLTDRPWSGLLLASALGVGVVWVGVAFSYSVPKAPPSFSIMTVAAGVYLASGCWARWGRGRPRRVGANMAHIVHDAVVHASELRPPGRAPDPGANL